MSPETVVIVIFLALWVIASSSDAPPSDTLPGEDNHETQ